MMNGRALQGCFSRRFLLAILSMTLILSSCFPKTPASDTSQPSASAPVMPALGADGQMLRKATTVRATDGAVANVPAGPIAQSAFVDLSQFTVPDEDRRWDLDASWRFISKAGLVITDPVVIDLPSKAAPQGAKVVVLGSNARWVELPTTETKLADGSQALRVSLKDVPTPWVLGIAHQRPDAPAQSELSRLEQLYWTNRQAWEIEALDWLRQISGLSLGPLSGKVRIASSAVAEAAPRRTWNDLAADLDAAIRTLGAVRVLQSNEAGLPLPGFKAEEFWLKGIESLYAIRKEWVAGRDGWASEEGGRNLLMFDSEKTIDQALETALATYAPWGIELTRYLAKSGALKGIDLKVIYGEEPYTDIPVAQGAVKILEDEVAAKLAERSDAAFPRVVPDSAFVGRFLRLYSTRAVDDWSYMDWLKDWKTEAFFRYLPAVLAAAGIVSGGPTMVASIAADQVLNTWQAMYEDADDPYMYAQVQWATEGAAGGSLFMDASKNFLRSTFHSSVSMADVASVRLSGAQFIYGAALSLATSQSEWYLLKDVRKLAEGSQAYCIDGKPGWFYSKVIPPIQLIAGVKGNLADQPAGAYPRSVQYLMSWSLDLGLVPDLHQLLADGKPEWLATAMLPLDNPKDGLRNLGFVPYKKELWPRVEAIPVPQGQCLRLVISRNDLTAIADSLGLSKSAPLKDYGLVFRLETPDGKRNIFQLAGELPSSTGGTPANVHMNVVLKAAGVEDLEGLPGEWSGEVQLVDGGVLRSTYQCSLKTTNLTDSEALLWEGQVQFTADNAIVQIEREDVESPKVHVKELTIPLGLGKDPVITALEPNPVWYGEELTIRGRSFGAAPGTVTMYDAAGASGLIATIKSWANDQITLIMPRGVIAGADGMVNPSQSPVGGIDVMVWVGGVTKSPTSPGGLLAVSRPELRDGVWKGGIIGATASNVATCQVGSNFAISGVSPASAQIGQLVTVSGKGFGATRADSRVLFLPPWAESTAPAAYPALEYVAWSDTQIKVKVPNNASAKVLVVEVGAKSSSTPFVIDHQAQVARATTIKTALGGTWTFDSTVKDAPKTRTEQELFQVSIQTSGAEFSWSPRNGDLVPFSVKSNEKKADGTQVVKTIRGSLNLARSTMSAQVVESQERPDWKRTVSYGLLDVPMTSATPTSLTFMVKAAEVVSRLDPSNPIRYEEVLGGSGALTLKSASFADANWAVFSITFEMPAM